MARFGGDEFALILPYTSKEGACAKAEMLREHIAQMDLANLELEPQSVSVGVATVPDDAHDRASVIAAAKTAVNAAKRSGRNTTIAYSRALTAAKRRPWRTGRTSTPVNSRSTRAPPPAAPTRA